MWFLLCLSLTRKLPLKKRFLSQQSFVLSQLFDGESDEEETVSEIEDNVEEDSDYEASSSDDNETPVQMLLLSLKHKQTLSKTCKVIMVPLSLEQQSSFSASNVMKMVPGLTRYAVRHEVSIGALHNTINEKDILEMMDLEGGHSGTVRRSWTHLQAHTLLLIFAGV